MSDSVWTITLATFRERIASLEPVPAGVTAAAVTGTLGLGLLSKVLKIARQRKDFAGDRDLVDRLLHDARNKSQIMTHLADEDIVAFQEYLGCLRRKESSETALRRTIEIPLSIARAAASGMELCKNATQLVHAFVAPDLATATALLSATVRSTLHTVESNMEQLSEADPYRLEVAAEARRLAENS